MLLIDQKLLNGIYAQSEKCYPHEACGFVVGKVEGKKRTAYKVVACTNIQNELHEKDPERYPRAAETAYCIDPAEMKKIEEQAKKEGMSLVSIFHSHPEHGVYFSAEDKAMACPWGEPLFPHLSYLVVSVYQMKVNNASEFYWSAEKKDFVERKIL
ncbi:MAG TPA: hypothetical protein DDW49_04710 [Deltaproteobacteria bacterium]|nr:MAG: hypothetical protein A2048_09470 [Deltaproteobacteria bacterium GWA2_45_12]HBF12679.1 hypothetical protein [Deltaproteobacteria bacterium]